MSSGKTKTGLLERLAAGPILGDGGMILGLERRGYAKLGVFTPESTVLHPDAGKIEKHFVLPYLKKYQLYLPSFNCGQRSDNKFLQL